jgi:hypothetical protein
MPTMSRLRDRSERSSNPRRKREFRGRTIGDAREPVGSITHLSPAGRAADLQTVFLKKLRANAGLLAKAAHADILTGSPWCARKRGTLLGSPFSFDTHIAAASRRLARLTPGRCDITTAPAAATDRLALVDPGAGVVNFD